MENSNYTMDDIAKFIEDYNESNKDSSREWVINIPVVGRKLYEKAAFCFPFVPQHCLSISSALQTDCLAF